MIKGKYGVVVESAGDIFTEYESGCRYHNKSSYGIVVGVYCVQMKMDCDHVIGFWF